MSDIHPLPLVGHDLPAEIEFRGQVFSRRTVTGHLDWYWHLKQDGRRLSATTHGPYWTAADANKEAAEMVRMMT